MLVENLKVEKMVHGGQAMATLPDGKKVFLWNALPGEVVNAELNKSKKGFAEGVAVEIIQASPDRQKPHEPEAFMATSPWQIVNPEAEARFKKEIIAETFEREKVELPEFDFINPSADDFLHYRNKMEYSFYGDDDGLHLALFNRGTHQKVILSGSVLASEAIDKTANIIVDYLNQKEVRASSLKSLMLRSNQKGQVVAGLFIKDSEFIDMAELGDKLHGLEVIHSNPKSPASVVTKILQTIGSGTLTDKVGEVELSYGFNSFFQVNLPVFGQALEQIKNHVIESDEVVDMYAGVGTIGLAIGADKLTIVEIDEANIEFAKQNSKGRAEVVHASSEKALDYVKSGTTLIVDPPRAGLHKDLVENILENKPQKLIYLSCNPITQARDLALLSTEYKINFFEGYNFFPMTPHIETLAILAISKGI